MSGSNAVRVRVDTITGRTMQSGGSIGGDKKQGQNHYGPTWSHGNMGNYLGRAYGPQPSIQFILTNTTRRPLQRRAYQASRNPMM